MDTFEKFDTIIILDAMRYDYYPRKAEKVKALGTCTWESIPRMFPGKYNMVYVSGTPVVNSVSPIDVYYVPAEHFEVVDDVWSTAWDFELKTTPPLAVLEATVHWQMKGKKVVVHFLQPHHPFIGKVKLKDDFSNVREAYKANVDLVIEYAMKAVNGTTLITADHGELLGENGYIGHTRNFMKVGSGKVDYEKLLSIPWEEIV